MISKTFSEARSLSFLLDSREVGRKGGGTAPPRARKRPPPKITQFFQTLIAIIQSLYYGALQKLRAALPGRRTGLGGPSATEGLELSFRGRLNTRINDRVAGTLRLFLSFYWHGGGGGAGCSRGTGLLKRRIVLQPLLKEAWIASRKVPAVCWGWRHAEREANPPPPTAPPLPDSQISSLKVLSQ